MEGLARLNFRDLGGLAVGGGRIRRGLLYRSEGPASFQEAEHTAVSGLGLRLVFDLRSGLEQRAAGANQAWGAVILACDVAADFRAGQGEWAGAGARLTPDLVRARMERTYAAMPAAFHPRLARIVEALAEGQLPALIHCTAGKDRTGVLVALLLSLLGAEAAVIEADYLASASFSAEPANRERVRNQLSKVTGQPIEDAVLDVVVGVDASYLHAAFAAIEARWGSPAAYFAEAGLDDALVARLAAALVEDSGAGR